MDWDTRLKISSLLKTYTVPKVIAEYYPGGLFGVDKEGSPIFYQPIGGVDYKGILRSARTDDILKSQAHVAERCVLRCKEQSEKLGKEITGVSLIYDLNGLGMKHLWRPGVKLFTTISSLFEERYPHLAKRIFVLNAPRIFPVAYSLVRPFLSEGTKEKIFIFGGDWKWKLQMFIDKSELPEYYGGTCRDENDDPMCRSRICYGGDVPESFYINSDSMQTATDCVRTLVKAGEVFTVRKQVFTPGAVIQWEYKTENYDLGFSVSYEGNNQADAEPTSLDILPFEKKQSHMVPEEASITCEKIGTYCLHFNNSYSWTRAKTLYYRIEVIEPQGLDIDVVA